MQAEDGEVYECRAKGIFRKEKIKPLPGDNVEMSVVQDGEKPAGNVDAILPRQNVLIRPAVANVDQALVIFAAASPKPNLNLLDRFLISMEHGAGACAAGRDIPWQRMRGTHTLGGKKRRD